MIDGKKLLDQFLGAEAGRSGVPTGVGSSGGAPLGGSGMPGGLGGLGDLLGGLTGGGASGGLGGVLGQVTDYAKKNPGMSTVIAGGLASVLMGGGSKLKPNALTLGGLAALGTLAYKAYQQYQVNNPAAPAAPAPAPAGASLPPAVTQSTATAEDAAALSIIIAMIAAAKADGHVDDEERQKILGKLSENGLTAEEQAFLDRELAAPLDFNRVVGLATSQEHAIQLYAASLLAINADQPAERGYLDMLAARLGIEPGLKTAIEQTVASAAA
ncbi:tellurite resistance TerB family protein [Mesorhizobium sp. BR1-1-16]|uniref:tellurite resistance TerB family protein n=1 Tax=Mesorhizobium sp. BR1-1-16 TaxID=2876653 RepID=UPI001CCDF65E|nr:tellurite resistance TerB family protein [Mesorhizobium sp. BR1-1-16]MBZ9939089.1 tellurite resistance TerB family protein [Mesorhizobium sp. BR1-1-16]